MSERTPDTLFKLLSVYKVEVPIVQRDYAQGRQDDHTKTVRSNLLSDMKSAILCKTKPLDLNFVYGKAEGNKFIPIDGQQRLTTLFLLHLYAFRDDDSKTELLHNFSYETRTSSRNFIKELIKNRKAVFMSELPPSKEIEDSEWFVSGWKCDPTIQSALTMLDDIRSVFGDVENLAQHLANQGSEPIVFKFLEMKDLGMEDSLYIKLNARGRPLTSLENFKARLIGRLQKLCLPITNMFELYLDREWTELFWSKDSKNFDQIYLTFFSGILMNNGIFQNDTNWSNMLDYEKIGAEIYETVFYTLKYLCDNRDDKIVNQYVFNALKETPTYPNRILFHAVSTYMYLAKGVDNGSLKQWLRIIRNLTLNTQIDQLVLYRRAIDGVNKLTENWDTLIEYFSNKGNVTGFTQEQIEEEQTKARIILQSVEFAEAIYQAEQHPYFSGQIRSALYYAMDDIKMYNKDSFEKYWGKVSSLFDKTKPKYGHLLRRAMLTFGDYTIRVGAYRTLCVDDPDEAVSTPSMKRLFSNHGSIVKCFLDALNSFDDYRNQLESIITNTNLIKSDWTYCFIEFPDLFSRMSVSHLRLREVNGELLIISNKSSSGYNYEVFQTSLHYALKQRSIQSDFEVDIGTLANRYLCVKGHKVQFKNKKFIVKDVTETVVFETQSDDPISEATQYLLNN